MNRNRRLIMGAGLSAVATMAFARGEKHRGLRDVSDVSDVRDARTASRASESLALWPSGKMPGGSGPTGPEHVSAKGSVTNVSHPRMNVYRPRKANGAAVLVISGGGYRHIELGSESGPACRWLQSLGVTAFELIYRLPDEGWVRTAPLQDGQRAMRVIRAAAPSFGIDVQRIGVLGFSAGGHLAGMTAVTSQIDRYASIDATDKLSSKPGFAGLIYPVLSLVPPFDNTETRRQLIGEHPSLAEAIEFSVDRQVTGTSPPTFLAQAKDDPVSPVDNSLMMFNALRKNDVLAEMHIFQAGGHGWGMGQPGSLVHAWPALFETWAVYNKLISGVPV
ncbi:MULTISPECIES: alpha/beta hydrolase [Paraburkholderia]|uniref:alpha/beta hydrolase n=1 Tax=Paraburkholderia TaxID=1822464 RepID=UPI002252DA31|nr:MULTISPECIES: alpha/beta hydrolase [Paraburkholderia]MCX4164147.1 alpha/beta hydrolase [Paraburkholderia megapolitana]MDN7159641.1 alpha/beta hydrolase [Paraburkholderia sp. CHISQ3]MDQ6496688.1 alpha/beta hydrolase [Paraburkholderia megapolitana]